MQFFTFHYFNLFIKSYVSCLKPRHTLKELNGDFLRSNDLELLMQAMWEWDVAQSLFFKQCYQSSMMVLSVLNVQANLMTDADVQTNLIREREEIDF